MSDCRWPEGTCACYAQNATRPDYAGRVWMHCEEGLSMTKASMSRFVMFCLRNRIEIGDIHPFNPNHDRCQVSASIRLKPEQFAAFESETGGKLRKPPHISLNSSNPANIRAALKGGAE